MNQQMTDRAVNVYDRRMVRYGIDIEGFFFRHSVWRRNLLSIRLVSFVKRLIYVVTEPTSRLWSAESHLPSMSWSRCSLLKRRAGVIAFLDVEDPGDAVAPTPDVAVGFPELLEKAKTTTKSTEIRMCRLYHVRTCLRA